MAEVRDKRRKFTTTQKNEVLYQQDNKCAICHDKLDPRAIDFDHIKEWSATGKTLIKNCAALCPNCHRLKTHNLRVKKIDKSKPERELASLSESKDSLKTAHAVVYGDLIDATVEACQLDSWDKWASRAVSTDMNWDKDSGRRLFEFYTKVIGAIWPKNLPELECSLKRLTYEVYEAFKTFSEHCVPSKTKDEVLVEERFYRSQGWIEDDKKYQQLVDEYQAWNDKCRNHIFEATKAANWFADVVRRDINPLFFATKGKFFIIMGPYDMLEFRSCFFEYTDREKEKMFKLCQEGWSLGIKPKQ